MGQTGLRHTDFLIHATILAQCENKTIQNMDSGDPNTGPHPCTNTLAIDTSLQSIHGVFRDSDPLPHERSISLCIRHSEKHRDRGRGGENPLCLI